MCLVYCYVVVRLDIYKQVGIWNVHIICFQNFVDYSCDNLLHYFSREVRKGISWQVSWTIINISLRINAGWFGLCLGLGAVLRVGDGDECPCSYTNWWPSLSVDTLTRVVFMRCNIRTCRIWWIFAECMPLIIIRIVLEEIIHGEIWYNRWFEKVWVIRRKRITKHHSGWCDTTKKVGFFISRPREVPHHVWGQRGFVSSCAYQNWHKPVGFSYNLGQIADLNFRWIKNVK